MFYSVHVNKKIFYSSTTSVRQEFVHSHSLNVTYTRTAVTRHATDTCFHVPSDVSPKINVLVLQMYLLSNCQHFFHTFKVKALDPTWKTHVNKDFCNKFVVFINFPRICLTKIRNCSIYCGFCGKIKLNRLTGSKNLETEVYTENRSMQLAY